MQGATSHVQQLQASIFVIEDDASLSQALGRLLDAASFRVRSFTSAEAALADASLAQADCFVLDVQLPGISGFELCSRLMCSGVTAPVILMTAHDDPIHHRTAREIGAAAYLIKPFSSLALIDAVVRAVKT
jgi:FixJ family two-component response regulator